MPIVIDVPNRGSIELPDGTPDEEIDAIVSKEFPPTGEDIAASLASDPTYRLNDEQFALFEEYSKNKQTDWIGTMAQAAEGMLSTIGSAAEAGVMEGAALNPYNLVEGFAQGTRSLVEMAAYSQSPDSPLFKFKNLIAGDGTLEARRKQFNEARDFAEKSQKVSEEGGLVVPKELTNPDFVRGVSLIADPTLFIPGFGEVFGISKLATKSVGKAAQIAGKTVSAVARPVEVASKAAERLAASAIGVSPEAAANVARATGVTSALGITPAVGMVGAIPTAAAAAGELGAALEAAGKNLVTQPSRIGPLEAIGRLPEANLRQRAIGAVGRYGGDVALDASLKSAAGAATGAAFGGGLGYLSGGEEGAAAGVGSGLALGAVGSMLGQAYGKLSGKDAIAARKGDFDRYVSTKDEKTAGLLRRIESNNGLDVASGFMDATAMLRGKLGDIEVRLLPNSEFVEKFGGGRGVQVPEAGSPVAYVNADIFGKGRGDNPLYTLGHEMFHALESAEQLSDAASRIKQDLVGTWSPDNTGEMRKVSEGLMPEADVERMFSQYRDKLPPSQAGNLSQYDTVQKRANYIASEIAAEHLGRLVSGQKPDAMLRGFTGLSRQLLDAALLRNSDSALSRMASRIEGAFGVKPVDSVVFPELKQASPMLNAMLRDLIRARGNLDKRIELADTSGNPTVLRPSDVANPVAAERMVDLGLAERNADGSVRVLADDEIAVREQNDTAELRRIVSSIPGAREVDGNISGRFSPEQLSAIEQSQRVSSRMRDKIRAVDAAMRNGNSIFIDYGAATRRALNRLTGRHYSRYSSGIRLSQREVLPYSFYLSKADNPVIKVIDITKMRRALQDITGRDGSVGGLWSGPDAFLTDLARYFTNLDSGEARRPSRELFGDERAKYIGDFVNEQEKGGRKFVRDIRIDRIGSTDPRDFRARISEEAIQASKLRWMPSENVGDTRVTNSEEGYRIVSGAKHRLYGPDGKLIGIFDTQAKAERKADATQTRIQPEVDQLQRPARDEGRQAAEAGGRNRVERGAEGQSEGGQARDVRFMPMSDIERSDLELRISTRNPSAKKATENPLTEQLSIDLEAISRTPGALPEMIRTLEKYPGIKFERPGSSNRANDFIRFVANNLLYLHDNVAPDIRNRSKLWYDGARKLAEDWSVRFNTSREGAAGVIASLSPQKDWYQNVMLAQRVFEVVKDHQNDAFTGPIEQWARTKMTSGQRPKRLVQDEVVNGMSGKKFSELSDYEKAVFVRAFDEVNNTRTYPVVSPEGEMLDIARKSDGTPATYAWGGFDTIAKAVKIAENPNKKTISESLGFEHKVRSFYDNILLPNNPEHGDVTIDTHAVAAALMLPLAGSDIYVAHNFGQGVPGSSIYGTSGTYGIYADAYRIAAKERGILPREMQSITWEAIRGLFTPEFKTDKNKKFVEGIWKDYKSGKATLDETRKRIVGTAGGIRNPSWYGPSGGAVAENAPSAQSQKLSGFSDLGRQGADAGRGSAIPGSGEEKIAGQTRFMPDQQGFYSNLEEVVTSKLPKSATPQQVLSTVDPAKGSGVKAEELKWTGFAQAVERIAKENGGKVPKEKLMQHLQNEGRVKFEEVNLSEKTVWTVGDQGHSEKYTDLKSALKAKKYIEDFWSGEIERGWDVAEQDGEFVIVDDYGDPIGVQKSDSGRDVWEPEPSYSSESEAYADLKNGAKEVARSLVHWHESQEGADLYSSYQIYGGKNYREIVLTSDTAAPYTSIHFDDINNYVAHMRVNERADAEGKSGLFIEEIQSDRHQNGRKSGYRDNAGVVVAPVLGGTGWTAFEFKGGTRINLLEEVGGFYRTKAQVESVLRNSFEITDYSVANQPLMGDDIPDAPFRKDWSLQMFKRGLRDAVASGKEWIGWTTGDTQAERYDLSKHIESLDVIQDGDGRYHVTANKGNKAVINEPNLSDKELEATIGKELAQRAIDDLSKKSNQLDAMASYSGLDLKVGGEGMKGFYDKILPAEVQKYVRQWGGEVKKSNIPEAPIWRVDITPEMRESVQKTGQPRFMPSDAGRNIDFANPPTEQNALDALYSSKRPFWRKHDKLSDGTPVGVRIDIPAFLQKGTYVQTVHEAATPGNVGDRIGYDTSVRLSGPVRFFVKEGSEQSSLGAVAIKEGRAKKHPIATVEGALVKDRSVPSDIDSWTPVGMNPKKHSYFYDKRTDRPVIGGSESYSVGNTVFVKDPIYGNPSEFKFMPDPSVPGAYMVTGGFRIIPGASAGKLRVYGPAGNLVGVVASLEEAMKIVRRKNKLVMN